MKPKTYEDAIGSGLPALSGIVRKMGSEKGEMYVRALLTTAIIELVEFFNVGKNMSEQQVVLTVEMIREEFWMLKPDDFKMCFSKAMRGHFGKVYDRLDGQTIMGWLQQHLSERCDYAEQKSYGKHAKFQAENRNSQYDRGINDAKQLAKISRIKSEIIRKKHNNSHK